MTTLSVVIASTRPGRAGLPVGHWVAETAAAHGGFEVEVADLAELALPMMDEPQHPRLEQYVHEHTHRWSALVDRADAFVFVTPEYNHGPAASLLNAISYLYREWLHKPVGFVSYGGASGGLRSVQAMHPVVSRLSMVPIPEGVAIPYIKRHVADGVFTPSSAQQESSTVMLDQLLRWQEALVSLRQHN
ncbi:NADPH-dependent FMN reductase [Nocardioides gilvus]|uniref:NADPH-dependent FMN reductase n=1 Tax=Nocardioides gilvus TaxID=1735589 RepID=UPI000D74A0BD|nr:NAD(P)H-dependent oxidoreductase [Nocardioides gilvus]